MKDGDKAILQQVREDIARLNKSLGMAQQSGLSAEIIVAKQSFVGALAPLVSVSGRLQRTRLEFDERL